MVPRTDSVSVEREKRKKKLISASHRPRSPPRHPPPILSLSTPLYLAYLLCTSIFVLQGEQIFLEVHICDVYLDKKKIGREEGKKRGGEGRGERGRWEVGGRENEGNII